MQSVSFRIAYPIILAGLFVILAIVAVNHDNLNTGFYVILFLLTVYIFLFGFATGQNFARPVKKLLQKADDLTRGNLKSRFYADSKDEIGQLGTMFNKLADEIEESRTQAETLEKSVDIKVQARTQSLEDTINALEQKVRNRTMELQRIVEDSEKEGGTEKLRSMEAENLKKELEREGYIPKKPEKPVEKPKPKAPEPVDLSSPDALKEEAEKIPEPTKDPKKELNI